MIRAARAGLALAGALFLAACAGPVPTPQSSRAPITPAAPLAEEQMRETFRVISQGGRVDGLRWPDVAQHAGSLDALYRQTDAQPIWIVGGKPTSQAREVLTAIGRAADAGLRADDYDVVPLTKRIAALAPKTPPGEIAKLDASVSLVVMRYLSDLNAGRVNPEHSVFSVSQNGESLDLARFTEALSRSRDVPGYIQKAAPSSPGYVQLVRALAQYRTLAANAALVPPPDLTGLKPGGRNPGVPALRRWLEGLGDAAPTDPLIARSDAYAGALVDAVKRFQERHGLNADGVLGKGTTAALSVPLRARVRQIELGLERWRWLPHSFPRPPILVNIPEFRLYALQGAGVRPSLAGALSMRVIVGEAKETETPVFSSEMEYVVFRPYWNVPYSIVTKEMLPKLRSDPGYLGRERLEIVGNGGRTTTQVSGATLAGLATGALGIRQRPGPDNSLGLVKFIFPNDESVYLHGTPAKALFARQRRDFSHGCIRVEDPVALGQYVLRDLPGWNRDRISAAMTSGTANQQVDLANPIPVYIVYLTATVGPGGELGFFEDLYGRDAQLEQVLTKGPPYLLE